MIGERLDVLPDFNDLFVTDCVTLPVDFFFLRLIKFWSTSVSYSSGQLTISSQQPAHDSGIADLIDSQESC